jgi:hypothetical protein
MKRSEIISILEDEINSRLFKHHQLNISDIDKIFQVLEDEGIKPPPVKAEKIRGENYRWGTMCTMRCSCEDCDPNYLIYQWESE